MRVNHSREKLIQVVTFFALNVRKLGKVKLFKLLYFADFMHYKETGRPVTDLQYFAWEKGPVPVSLFEELSAPRDDWKGKVAFNEISTARGPMLSVNAITTFDPSHFSRRELRLLSDLATEFKDATADQMIEQTHLENSPWHKIWEAQGARQQPIPYALALRAQDAELMRGLIADRQDVIEALNEA